jgi:beta-fructofuranosidase
MLQLADYWIWDSWIADDGELYHLFFLQAPRSLVDPGKRHTRATIGHATSADLHNWQYRGDALLPVASGWDDLALWTGSVVRGDDGIWRMYYTALSTAGHGILDQRIGMVESGDLYVWRRVIDKPIIEVDPRWYQTLAVDNEASETWRDPFVFRDPDGDGWHMLIAGRAVGAARYDDGVLGHARSADMVTWEVMSPISEPAGFGQIEVPQVRLIEGQPVLVFTCHPEEQTERRKQTYGRYSTWSVTGESIMGPWEITQAQPFIHEAALFAAPLVQQRDGEWALIGFRNLEPEGIFAFEILDPIPVRLQDGSLVAAFSTDARTSGTMSATNSHDAIS